MTAYAIAHLRPTDGPVPEEVFVYMERIQETFAPFGGHFLVHGTTVEVREGTWPGALVMVGFPSMREARSWYDSAPYQSLLPLRTNHIPGDLILVDGVPPNYDPAKTAANYREAQGAGE
ncbi:hypothetical protein A8W25_19155 [Streptomyces sp. ERV7]|uniref:DUF1330 domain-containing protein n=1 Tax=Streptomyces sp. ERV7 TaxID=1322334 RepID=UPI0007F46C88|nr:DUF1330 domain-containing protein [Streptomyces sp. ERV7]OAR24512.1 hypothetical protein A8W25_19155 [Streptomyces sp. ERV7]